MEIERIIGLVATAIFGGARRKFGYDEEAQRVWVEARSGAEAAEVLTAFGRASKDLNQKASKGELAVFEQLAKQTGPAPDVGGGVHISLDAESAVRALDLLSKGDVVPSAEKVAAAVMATPEEVTPKVPATKPEPEMRPVGEPDSKGGMSVDVGVVPIGPELASKVPEKPAVEAKEIPTEGKKPPESTKAVPPVKRRRNKAKSASGRLETGSTPSKEPKSPSKSTSTVQDDVEKGAAAKADMGVFSQHDKTPKPAELSDDYLRKEFEGARQFKDIVSTLHDAGHNDVDSAYVRLISISPEEPESSRVGNILRRVRVGTLKSRFLRTWRLLKLPGYKEINT